MTYPRNDSFEGVPIIGRITPVTYKDAIIPYDLWDPHYTDRRFIDGTTDGLTIYADPIVDLQFDPFGGETGEGLFYNYSDRLVQALGHEVVADAIHQAREEVGNSRSAKFVEHMLRIAFRNDSLWLGHMKAGVNRWNGYSYKIYGYRTDNEN